MNGRSSGGVSEPYMADLDAAGVGGGVMFRLRLASVSYSCFDHSGNMSPLEFLCGFGFTQAASSALTSL